VTVKTVNVIAMVKTAIVKKDIVVAIQNINL
jgi:hypothetical protein